MMLKNIKYELRQVKFYNSKYYNKEIVRLENNIYLLKKIGSKKFIENKKELEYIKKFRYS